MHSSNSNSNSKPNKSQESAPMNDSDSERTETDSDNDGFINESISKRVVTNLNKGVFFELLRFSTSLKQWIYYVPNSKTQLLPNLSRGIYDPRRPVEKQTPVQLEKKATFERLDISFRKSGNFAFAFPNKKPAEGIEPFPGKDKHALLKIYYGLTQYSLKRMNKFAKERALDEKLEEKALAAYSSIPYEKTPDCKGVPKTKKLKNKKDEKDKYNSDCEMSEGTESSFDSDTLESDDDNSAQKTAGTQAAPKLTQRQLELEKTREATTLQNKEYEETVKQREAERKKERQQRRAAQQAAKKKSVKIEKPDVVVAMEVDQGSIPIKPIAAVAVEKSAVVDAKKRRKAKISTNQPQNVVVAMKIDQSSVPIKPIAAIAVEKSVVVGAKKRRKTKLSTARQKIEKVERTAPMDVDQSSNSIAPTATIKPIATTGKRKAREEQSNSERSVRARFFAPVVLMQKNFVPVIQEQKDLAPVIPVQEIFGQPVKLEQIKRFSPTLFGKEITQAWQRPSPDKFLDALELDKWKRDVTGVYYKLYEDEKICWDARDFFDITAKSHGFKIRFIAFGNLLYLGSRLEESAQAKSDLENASINYRTAVGANNR